MKPSIRPMFRPVLPACVFIQFIATHAFAASPNEINPDAAGNVVVSGTFDETNGSDWTVVASGGNGPTFTVDLKNGLLLTGSNSFGNAVRVTSAKYAIFNSGTLRTNSDAISVLTGATSILNRSGATIEGGGSGISHSPEDGNIENSGIILGRFSGISGNNGLTVLNQQSGTITGGFIGISGSNNLTLTNYGDITGGEGSFIVGRAKFRKGGSGIQANQDASITNTGTITGLRGDGITTGNGLLLTNSGTIKGEIGEQIIDTIAPLDGPVFDGPVLLVGASGVSTGDGASIANAEDGLITGPSYGVFAGHNLVLANSGTIEGTGEISEEFPGGIGVYAGSGANINNSGTITGTQHGIQLHNLSDENEFEDDLFFVVAEPGEAASAIINSGTITGTNGHGILGTDGVQTVTNSGTLNGKLSAITTLGGNDEIHLTLGSVVNGDIQGGEGTDLLHFDGGFTSQNSKGNIVHGNVGGIETITKTGSGFAFIGGPGESFNVMADAIEVSSGGLVINGNLMSLSEGKTKVTLSGGGQLDGTGEWAADIVVANGGISAGSDTSLLGGDGNAVPLSAAVSETTNYSVGTLTVNGDITHSTSTSAGPRAAQVTDSHIRVDIIPDTPIVNGVNSDLIVQNGPGNTYNLAGVNLRIAPTDINRTLTNGTYTVIDSDSPLQGVKQLGTLGVQFTANAPDTGKFRANQSGDNNLNTVIANHFTTVHVTDPVNPGQEGENQALAAPTTIAQNGSNLEITIEHDFAGLPGLNRNQRALAGVVDSLVGSSNPLYQDFVAALDYSDLANVQSTLAALDPANSMGLAVNVANSNYRLHLLVQDHLAAVRGSGREVIENVAATTDAKGAITTAATTSVTRSRANAWGTFSYDAKDYDGGGGGSDHDGDEGSFTAGFDWLVAPNLVLGLVLDGSKGDYDDSGFESDIDSFRGAVYGTWGQSTGFYSDALVGFGDHDLESSLDPAGVLLGNIGSDTSASSLQALWTIGYAMGDQMLKHGPFAGLEYQNVDVDGYTQTGALPIAVSGYEVDSLRALIGYRVNANLGTFRPYASLAYAHEFEDGTISNTATLAGTGFTTTGAELGSALLITAGTGIDLTHGFTLDVGYRGEVATDDGMSSHGGSLGVNYSF
jgi:uncharacterized protein YhjY with autotransporter beta-barrel domain